MSSAEDYEFVIRLEYRGESTGWSNLADALENGLPHFIDKARKEALPIEVEVRRTVQGER